MTVKRKFWNWVRNEGEKRTLLLDGEISDETWFGDEVTPAIFREELHAAEGDVVLWINSPGGDCFAAAQIYNMLMDYPGSVAVKIDGLAASAASVIAMAGSTVEISPVGMGNSIPLLSQTAQIEMKTKVRHAVVWYNLLERRDTLQSTWKRVEDCQLFRFKSVW